MGGKIIRRTITVMVLIVLVGLGVRFGAYAIRLRQFESGPTPVVQLVNVELGGASDNGKYFGCSVDRKVKGYTLSQACIWTPDGHLTKLATDGLFTSTIGWVSNDGKRATGLSELDDVPIDDPKKPTSYICQWSTLGGVKKTAVPDFGTVLSRDGSSLAYNTFFPPAKGSNFEFGDSKTIELKSFRTGKAATISTLRGAKVDALSNDGHIFAGSLDVTAKPRAIPGNDPKMTDFAEIFSDHHTRAAVWIDGRMTQITDLDSWATDCSPDGNWVVGICCPSGDHDQRGFRWSHKTGFEVLPGPMGRNLRADGVTADGKTVILDADYRVPGQEHADMFQEPPKDGKPHLDPDEKIFKNQAFIWHEGVGTIPLQEYLVKRGAKVGKDDVFSYPHYISPDGHMIICAKTKGWSIPEGSYIIRI